MTPLCSAITSFVLVSVWLIPSIAAFAWLAGRLAARISPLAEHRVWVTAYLLSLVLPVLPAARHLLLASGLISLLPSSPAGTAVSIRLLPSSALSIVSPPTILTRVVAALWLLSVLVCLLRLARSLTATVHLLRRTAPLSPKPALAELWETCQQAFFLPPTPLLVSSAIAAPLTLSLPRPVLVLPTTIAEYGSPHELETALAHECAHIQRHDFRSNLLYELLGTLTAFHPATALLKARLAASREMVCDDLAIRTLVPRPVYVRSLLRLATLVAHSPSSLRSHAIGIFDANILEKRIMALKAERPHLTRTSKRLFATLSILLLTSAATGVAAAALLFTPASASSSADAQSTAVLKVGGPVSAPRLIHQVEPEFSAADRKRPGPFNGTCILSLVVDRSGIPRKVQVVRPLGKDFDANAIAAVRQYRFSPALHAGQPVPVAIQIEVNFQKF